MNNTEQSVVGQRLKNKMYTKANLTAQCTHYRKYQHISNIFDMYHILCQKLFLTSRSNSEIMWKNSYIVNILLLL